MSCHCIVLILSYTYKSLTKFESRTSSTFPVDILSIELSAKNSQMLKIHASYNVRTPNDVFRKFKILRFKDWKGIKSYDFEIFPAIFRSIPGYGSIYAPYHRAGWQSATTGCPAGSVFATANSTEQLQTLLDGLIRCERES